MADLQFFLFGKFCVCYKGQPVTGLEARRIQELLCYLLIHQEKIHPREKLATLLWKDSTTRQSKHYLSQALCQLRSVFDGITPFENEVLIVDLDWIQINPCAKYWTDIGELEAACLRTQGRRGRELDGDDVKALSPAIENYRGELLENWYLDWCIFERERYQNMYLTLLDKLMGYCEAFQEYEQGIIYGALILRCDLAHERTYRRLMRLHYLAGNRSGALRQFELCQAALMRELNARPAAHTVDVYNQIKSDQFDPEPMIIKGKNLNVQSVSAYREILSRLTLVRKILLRAQNQIEEDIKTVKSILGG